MGPATIAASLPVLSQANSTRDPYRPLLKGHPLRVDGKLLAVQ